LTRACGPALTLLLAAGNIPVAALPSLYHSLLVGSSCLVRTSSAEPVLLPAVMRSLCEAAPRLGGAGVAVLAWPGDAEEVTRALAAEAEAVIAYGSDATLHRIRSLTPGGARFLGYGHRIGFGVIGREALAATAVDATAEAAAMDVAAFDQQGCVSPQWFWVERGGEVSPEEFRARLGRALAAPEVVWPRRGLSAAEASAIHQARARYEIREDARVWTGGGTQWTVIYDPDRTPEPGCLNRMALIKPVDDVIADLPEVSGMRGHLQTVVYALSPERARQLAEILSPGGVTRLAPLGRSQELPAGARPDPLPALPAP